MTKKKEFYRLIMNDYNYGIGIIEDHLEAIKEHVIGASDDDSDCEIYISRVRMTQKQFDKLPEVEL